MLQPPSFQICMPDPTSDAWAAADLALNVLWIGVTIFIARAAHRLSKQLFLTEESPIILLGRADGHTQLTNVGKGTAVATYVLGPDRDDVIDVGVIAAGQSQVLSGHKAAGLDFKGHRSNELFYQSLSGRWWYAVATTKPVRLEMPNNVTCAHQMQQIGYRFGVPRQIKKKVRTRARSIEGHLVALSSPITRDGFVMRVTNLWKDARMTFERVVSSIGETKRISRLQPLALPLETAADPPESEQWELQVSGVFYCWHTHGPRIWQYSCRTMDGQIVCDVGLEKLSGDVVRGVLVVSRAAYERAGHDRYSRSESIFKRLNVYLCKRSPREFFALEIT